MLSPITNTNHTSQVTPAVSTQPSTKSNQNSSGTGKTDAVQLSNAAQAALKEASETPAQTAKEAGSGDMVAKRLLAKEHAEKVAGK